MPNSTTKSSLTEKDISDLKKEVDKLSGYMCNITEHLSTPKIERGCKLSEELETLIKDLTPLKADQNVIKNIRATLDDISDIAVGVEVGAEELLIPARKSKKHFHNAKKLVMSALPTSTR